MSLSDSAGALDTLLSTLANKKQTLDDATKAQVNAQADYDDILSKVNAARVTLETNITAAVPVQDNRPKLVNVG